MFSGRLAPSLDLFLNLLMLISPSTLNLWYNTSRGVAKSHKKILVRLSIKFSLHRSKQDKNKVSNSTGQKVVREEPAGTNKLLRAKNRVTRLFIPKNFLYASLCRLCPPSLPVIRYSFLLFLRLRFSLPPPRSLRKVAQFVLLLPFDV